MAEQATDTRSGDPDELAATVEAGGFWRLVPGWVPRHFAEPTPTLLEHVERGLRRLVA
ncbi:MULTISPECIES: hypothetical protein [unclassified Streptomyces]|uniref:hypothetical protein n=1 Tax=unclassified Streptomyces TaxID=2593676 RepID=UPI00343EE053